MALNGLEAGLLALWALGVVSAILAGRRGGFTLRARVAILGAFFLPVLGSLLAIAYLGPVTKVTDVLFGVSPSVR